MHVVVRNVSEYTSHEHKFAGTAPVYASVTEASPVTISIPPRPAACACLVASTVLVGSSSIRRPFTERAPRVVRQYAEDVGPLAAADTYDPDLVARAAGKEVPDQALHDEESLGYDTLGGFVEIVPLHPVGPIHTHESSGSLGHVRRVNCTIEAMGRYGRPADR
jgi:hypothetical protein